MQVVPTYCGKRAFGDRLRTQWSYAEKYRTSGETFVEWLPQIKFRKEGTIAKNVKINLAWNFHVYSCLLL